MVPSPSIPFSVGELGDKTYCKLLRSVVSLALVLELGTIDALATPWKITTPRANISLPLNSNVATGGTGPTGNAYVVNINNIASGNAMNSGSGSVGTESDTWSCTVSPPSGNWTAGAATIELIPAADGMQVDSRNISFSGS